MEKYSRTNFLWVSTKANLIIHNRQIDESEMKELFTSSYEAKETGRLWKLSFLTIAFYGFHLLLNGISVLLCFYITCDSSFEQSAKRHKPFQQVSFHFVARPRLNIDGAFSHSQ